MEDTRTSSLFMERLLAAQDDLHGYVAAMLPFNPDDVDDVVQETDQALILHAAGYDSSRPFTPWMLAFAKNQILAFRKRRQEDRLILNEDLCDRCAAFLSEDSRPDREPVLKRLRVCRQRLPERQRQLLALRYESDQTSAEIARALGNTPRNIRDNLAYVRKKLADCLQRLCRMDDDAFGKAYPDASKTDGLTLDLIEGEKLSRADREELVRGLSASGEAFRRYFEQMRVHTLLLHEARLARIGRRKLNRRVWNFLAKAALLAILAGGLAWGYSASRARQTAVAPVVQSAAAVTNAPAASPAASAVITNAPAAPAAAAKTVSGAASAPVLRETTSTTTQKEGTSEMKSSVAILSAALTAAAAPAADSPDYSGVTTLDTRVCVEAANEEPRTLDSRVFAEDWSAAIPLDTAKAIGTVYRFE